MKHASKRIIALLLAVVMVIGILPFASAANVGPFTDVQDTEWYAPYVKYVYEHDLMNGTSATKFEPNGTCTRAMAVTVLYRMAGSPIVYEKASFTDLTDDWYKNAVAWAEDEGIVNGMGGGRFDPTGLLTREQLVTMVWRYKGQPEAKTADGINAYPDAASINSWAVDAFNWAISKGIINGMGGKLLPGEPATRAQFAKIITVFLQTDVSCTTHTWAAGDVITEPTCTEAGLQQYTCSVCGEKKTEAIPALGHDYVDGVCSRCGDKLADDNEIVIYYTNDVHTYIDGSLSYDSVADLKAQTSKVAAGTLLLDAGDHIQGTYFGTTNEDNGGKIIEMMNAAGYDAATLGNHEFDYGMERTLELIERADFPYLSANFYHEANGVKGDNVLDSYKIFEVGGKKIAVIGVTTPESFTKSTPKYFQDEEGNYIFGIAGGEDGSALYASVQAAIDAAKAENPDYIIALGHCGDDVSSKPWTSEEVIANTTGLDAWIDGHSHSTVVGKEVTDKGGNTVLLTQTGSYFAAIGKMTIKGDTITTELITDYAGSDATVAEMKNDWMATCEEVLGKVVAYSEVTLDNYDANGNRLVRKQETNTGDFAADALYYLFDVTNDLHVDAAIMNGGGVRNKAVTGELNGKSFKSIHTFGNVACLIEVTGQQILDALEWGAKDAGVGECGGFLQVSGITYEIHTYIPSTVQKDDKGVWTGAPTGDYRVKNVTIGGEPLDTAKTYRLAGYNYTLRDLGDGFAMFDGATNILDYVMTDWQVLQNYALSFPTDAAHDNLPTIPADSVYSNVNGNGRITLVAEKPVDPTPETGYVAIYSNAKGKAMTTATSSYTNPNTGVTKMQIGSADATLKDGKLSTTASNIALFKMVTENGVTTFQTEDGKWLHCDGTNLTFEDTFNENCEFILDEVDGGYYIRLANFLYNGSYAQYLEFYANVFTCFGMTAGSDTSIYIFNFYEVENGSDTPDVPVVPGEGLTFEKVTSDLGSWEGTYVVGYDLGDGTAAVFTGAEDKDGNGVIVATSDNKVTVPAEYAITIATMDGGYSLKAAAGYLNGKTNSSGLANGIKFEEAPTAATIAWTSGNPIITSAAGSVLRYNNGADYNDSSRNYSWFRFYKPASSVQTPVALYKLAEGATPVDPVDPPVDPVDPPVDPVEGDVFALSTELKDGDEVVIYNPGNGKALEGTMNGYYVTGTDVTPADNKITAPATALVWKVTKNADGSYTFKQDGGNVLGTGSREYDGKTYYNLYVSGEYADNWTIESLDEATSQFIIYSAELTGGYGNVYLEWYAKNAAFSAYDTGRDRVTATDFGFQFYVKGAETAPVDPVDPPVDPVDPVDPPVDPADGLTFEKVTSDLGSWEGTYVVGYDLGDGTAAVFTGAEDKDGNGVIVATSDNKVTVPAEYAITIATMDGGYSVKAAAGYLNGKTNSSGLANGTKFETAPVACTIAWTDGNPIITSAAGSILRYNNGADYNDSSRNYSWFRFYKPTSSVQTPIALYKLAEGATPVDPVDPPVDPVDPPVDPVDPPVDPVEGDVFALSTELKDGDEVVIYNPGNGKALEGTMNGYYVTGTDVTPADNKITAPATALVWKVTKNADGSYTFKQDGGNVLGTGTREYNGKTYYNLYVSGEYADNWTIESLDEATSQFIIYSAELTGGYGNVYLEWYAKNAVFSAYDTGRDRVTATDFGFQFYVKDAETAPVDPVDPPVDPVDPVDPPVDPVDPPASGNLVATAWKDLKATDKVVIVMHAPATDKDYVLLNNGGTATKGPAAIFDGTADSTMCWNVVAVEGGFKLCVAGSTDSWLYATTTNNGIFVGTSETGCVWNLDETYGYLSTVDSALNTRFLGLYDNNGGDVSKVPTPNFRSYKLSVKDGVSIMQPNIANQTITFYVVNEG